jgi:hypothetical protein
MSRHFNSKNPFRWSLWRLALDLGCCTSCSYEGQGWRSEWRRLNGWLMWRTKLVAVCLCARFNNGLYPDPEYTHHMADHCGFGYCWKCDQGDVRSEGWPS